MEEHNSALYQLFKEISNLKMLLSNILKEIKLYYKTFHWNCKQRKNMLL